jgi:hypothetical protein
MLRASDVMRFKPSLINENSNLVNMKLSSEKNPREHDDRNHQLMICANTDQTEERPPSREEKQPIAFNLSKIELHFIDYYV